MMYEIEGKVVKGLGGLYEICVDTPEGERVRYSCRAKGILHREEAKLLIGDNVLLRIDEDLPDSIVISKILTRKNALIRPPLANLDYLFIVFASAKPAPVLETIDKLISIAEHNQITPVIVITKSDIADQEAERLADLYQSVGLPVFVTSSKMGEGVEAIRAYISKELKNGATAAFAGASGVGKSTLLNAVFPNLSLATAEISRKIERGRHTTRHVELFEIPNSDGFAGYLADTPGFSLIDFERFDFFDLDSLFPTFREFLPYMGKCRYADCAHVGESAEECAVARAALDGEIPKSRLESYRSIYRVLKSKNEYK